MSVKGTALRAQEIMYLIFLYIQVNVHFASLYPLFLSANISTQETHGSPRKLPADSCRMIKSSFFFFHEGENSTPAPNKPTPKAGMDNANSFYVCL